MNSYELVLILRTDVPDEGRTAVLDRTKEIITGGKGAIVKIDEWGKRRLAYEIKDSLDGVYYILYFEATPKTLDEVTRVLGITDSVLRFMPIKRDKPFGPPQAAAAPAAPAVVPAAKAAVPAVPVAVPEIPVAAPEPPAEAEEA